jgi:NAD(P)-dependent dehydrogenase (short-subunit alcohol dehydrogenase family)
MRWIITGANRGIGLELAKQLVKRGDHVEAGTRDPSASPELAALEARSERHLRVHRCDVASDESVRAFRESVGDAPIDVLVNNAGVYGKMQSLEELDLDDVRSTFEVNALGPIRVTRALVGQLLQSKTRRLVHITSGMGSIADNESGGAYGYRMSKAALNMANKSMSVDYASRGIVAVVINPGWVQTDMGGAGAPVTVSESVRLMLGRIDALTAKDNGSFLNYKGGTYAY